MSATVRVGALVLMISAYLVRSVTRLSARRTICGGGTALAQAGPGRGRQAAAPNHGGYWLNSRFPDRWPDTLHCPRQPVRPAEASAVFLLRAGRKPTAPVVLREWGNGSAERAHRPMGPRRGRRGHRVHPEFLCRAGCGLRGCPGRQQDRALPRIQLRRPVELAGHPRDGDDLRAL